MDRLQRFDGAEACRLTLPAEYDKFPSMDYLVKVFEGRSAVEHIGVIENVENSGHIEHVEIRNKIEEEAKAVVTYLRAKEVSNPALFAPLPSALTR